MLNKIRRKKKKEENIDTLSSPKRREFFPIIIGFRIDKENYSKLKIISSNKLRFENLSHLIRCALIKFIKEEENANKRTVH
jgi:hypothetical protein